MKISTINKISLRYAQKKFLQTLLLILGIAIGVAVIIAIDLANNSSNKAFQISTQGVIGKSTHQITNLLGEVDENVYTKIKRKIGFEKMTPVVSGYIKVKELKNKNIKLIGINPLSEIYFRNYIGNEDEPLDLKKLNRFFTEKNTVFISKKLATEYNFKINDTLKISNKNESLKIVGFISTSDKLEQKALNSLIITDISNAQTIFNKVDKLDYIDLIIDPKSNNLKEIKAIIPKNLNIESSEAKNQTLFQISKAFRINLTALSLLAIVVGAFLIYNTVTFSIIQRKSMIAILRAIGLTNKQVFKIIIKEAAIYGFIGTFLGLGLGFILAKGVVQIITQTINDFYFTVSVNDIPIPPITIIKGIVIGMLASILSAIIPALEATKIPPINVLKRLKSEKKETKNLYIFNLLALILIISSYGLFSIPKSLFFSFCGLFCIILSLALLVPYLTKILLKLIIPIFNNIFGLIGNISIRSIIRSLSKTSVAIAALMIAVSVIVAMSIMIGSFRQTVVTWLDDTLTADIFISTINNSNNRNDGFSKNIIKEIEKIPDIEKVISRRVLRVYDNKYGIFQINALSAEPNSKRKFVWQKKTNIWQNLLKNNVIVSETFAYRNKIKPNKDNKISLITNKGEKEFKVIGVYYDYSSELGTVLFSEKTYIDNWKDNKLTSLSLYLKNPDNTKKITKKLNKEFANKYNLLIQSNNELKSGAIDVFDRTFKITSALRLLTTIVAFIGIFSTLMALQLERESEFGTLRALGLTENQLRKIIFLETSLMGFVAGVFAIPSGLILSYILVHIINVRSFGWSLEIIMKPEYFLQSILIATISAILAGIYPSIKIGKMNISKSLRTE